MVSMCSDIPLKDRTVKQWITTVAISLIVTTSAHANDGPSRESIDRLLELMDSRALIENSMQQVESQLRKAMRQVMGNEIPSPEAQVVIDDMQSKLMNLLGETLAWERMEPEMIAIYRDSFTEQEINGMIAFYSSPAGQAVVKKMPVVMEHTMNLVYRQTQLMTPKLERIQVETVQALQACCSEEFGDMANSRN